MIKCKYEKQDLNKININVRDGIVRCSSLTLPENKSINIPINFTKKKSI